MSSEKRGVDPKTLLSLVENTAPFLFQKEEPKTPFTEIIFQARKKVAAKEIFSHFEYFEFCLGAHYSTVATFVPTDVDNQIRKHLWDQKLLEGTTEKMAALVLRSYEWDFRPLTARFASFEEKYVSGHQGEWFSVAVGAYAAHRKKNPSLAEEMQQKILQEARQEAEIFSSLKKAKNGLELLRASAMIAHNFGDLDRVIDQWELPAEDPLRLAAYKLGHQAHPSFGALQENLLEAGALYKAYMASENHRHFPLRKPKCLRRSLDFILPISPFLDAWGENLASSKELNEVELAEVASALLEGFERLSSPKIPLYGYARALGGLQRAFPGGPKMLLEYLPSKAGKEIQSPKITQIVQSRDFEAQWAKKALSFLKIL